jgi:AraC-like DNA-binding protein
VRNSAPGTRVEALADTEVLFNPVVTGVRFPAVFLTRPLGPDSAGLASTDANPDLQRFTETLATVIRDRLGHVGYTDHSTVAEIANLSPRTVQRRLSDEGLTFQRLTDRIRFQLASALLEDATVTARDVSESLGYSGKNHFLRAFRRFTGMTPTEYRQLRLEEEA